MAVAEVNDRAGICVRQTEDQVAEFFAAM